MINGKSKFLNSLRSLYSLKFKDPNLECDYDSKEHKTAQNIYFKIFIITSILLLLDLLFHLHPFVKGAAEGKKERLTKWELVWSPIFIVVMLIECLLMKFTKKSPYVGVPHTLFVYLMLASKTVVNYRHDNYDIVYGIYIYI